MRVRRVLPSRSLSALTDEPVESSSDTMRFVTNLPIEEVRPGASRHTVDMDFWTTTVTTRPGGAKAAAEVGPHEREVPLDVVLVVDITDRENPEIVAVYDCALAQADVFPFEREDLRRTFVALTAPT